MIRFTDKQWDEVRENHRKWWKNELGRPILPLVIGGADPMRDKPKNPVLSFANCNDLSITPEQIIDRYDYELSTCEFHGDSFPHMHMDQFGPGVGAAFLGCNLENDTNTVWFTPKKKVPIRELHLAYDPDNPWLVRIKDIYRAGMKKWGGNVCMGMTDLGGVLDIPASFLTTDQLLYDLYDEPEEVQRLVWEISDLWSQFYSEILEIIAGQQGFSDWAAIYSEKPSYMLQCDFCYMISNGMFRQFVLEELKHTAKKLYRPFYHLDGVGELRHLDDLLAQEDIYGIQWVPGEGPEREMDWSEVYSKISKAGKKIQAYYDFDHSLDDILAVIQHPDDLVKTPIWYPMDNKDEALKKLNKYL